MNELFDRLLNPDVDRFGGDPVASAITSGSGTTMLEGNVDSVDWPVRVEKFYESDNGDEWWVVRVTTPTTAGSQEVTKRYEDEFTAEAVMEKLQREHKLQETSVHEDK